MLETHAIRGTSLELIIPVRDSPPQQVLVLPAKQTATARKPFKTPWSNLCGWGRALTVRQAALPNNMHLFMPTAAKRLAVFVGLAVTQYIFIAYIYWQGLVVDLLKDLCSVSHPYNCIQGLCKYSKPSNSLKLLFHFSELSFKRNTPFFPHTWNTMNAKIIFAQYSGKEQLLTQHHYYKTKQKSLLTVLQNQCH